MIFQHSRYQVWNITQHPYRHGTEDIAFSSDVFGDGVTNLKQALDWMLAVLYPNVQPDVADQAELNALVGNNINDYRVVNDDGDGNPAGYRYEQREGDAAAKWYKIYDYDWSSDAILASFQDATQDMYVHLRGRDELDDTGTPLGGDDGGQNVYGGKSANTHLTLRANIGDGVGAQTGYVQFGDNVRPYPGLSLDLGNTTDRWNKVWSDEIQAGTLNLVAGTITDSSGLIDFDDEDLTTTGTITSGTLTISGALITDTTGDISFGDEDLTTTGTVTANDVQATGAPSAFASGTTVGNLTLSDGSIVSATNIIDFVNTSLTTLGGVTGSNGTFTNSLTADRIYVYNNIITGTAFEDLIIKTSSAFDDVDIQSNTKTLNLDATGNITATGNIDAAGWLEGGNIRIDTDTISTASASMFISANNQIQLDANTYPQVDDSYSLGSSGQKWRSLFLTTNIEDGTNNISMATLMSFRDATVGANVGDALFWDGSKWAADHPDTEIDHGEIAGIGDDDHTQYALLAGRPGGQVLIGGDGIAENLDLIGTSNAFYGQVRIGGQLVPLAAHYDLGTGGSPWHDLVMTGEAKGMRLENAANFASLPPASATTPGRMAYLSDETGIVIDAGGNWLRVSTDTFYTEDAVNWDGATASVSYDVSTTVTNAKKMVWQFKDNTNNYKVLAGAEITHTSDTNVTVTFGIDLPAGTYTLVGR